MIDLQYNICEYLYIILSRIDSDGLFIILSLFSEIFILNVLSFYFNILQLNTIKSDENSKYLYWLFS